MKRFFDIIVSLFLISTFAIPIFILVLLVRSKLGKPAFFKQERPGKNGKIFVMYKFRTMTEERDSTGVLLPDSARLTVFGKFLRSTSLDELPEIWNVLKGDMSLVGPRPLLKEYLPLYTDEQNRRHEVRPGITGWAQVNGRNAITWKEKFKLDVWYVDNRSIFLDLKILILTVQKVVRRSDISASNEATMRRFSGKED